MVFCVSNWSEYILFTYAPTTYFHKFYKFYLTHVLLNPDIPAFANSVDPDQLASEEANWSESALFDIKYVNLYQQSGTSNLIGCKLEVGVASWFIQQDKG